MNQMRGLLKISLLLSLSVSFAQVDSTSTGEVVDAEIVIEKDRQIRLNPATKLNTPTSNALIEIQPLQLSYKKNEPEFSWPAYKSEVGFERFNEPFPQATYQNSIKAGFGNYSSPLLELRYFKKFSEVQLNTALFHESFQGGPIAGSNSSSSTTEFQIRAGYKSKSLEFTPELYFNRNGYRFYGNSNRQNTGYSNESISKAARNAIGFRLKVKGGTESLNYYIQPSVFGTNQAFVDGLKINQENGLSIQSGLSIKIDNAISTGFDLEGFTSNYEGGIEYNRNLITVRPWISRSSEEFLLKAGFAFSSTKAITLGNNSGIYPFVDAEWKFDPQWSLFVNVGSGFNWNSLNSILDQHQFLDDSLIIDNTETEISLKGGIKGYLTNNLQFESHVKWESVNALPFFIPSTDSSRYTLTYEGETNILTFGSKLTYATSTNSIFGIGLNLYNYTTTSLEKAWHLPSYTFLVSFTKNFNKKFLVNTEIIAQGGINSPGATAIEVIELGSFVDLNLNLDYKATERVSVFLKLNNLLNKEYERYIGYPVRGATFKVGGKYRF